MNTGGDSGNDRDTKQKEDAEKRNQEIRANILAQILDQDARARLNTIAITKPEKAKMVENMLINMAQTGRLGPKLSEEQLKQILLQVSSGTQKSTTVKFDRRRAAIDSDEDSL
ncbi:Programmed cell death protein 5 [Schistosoma japonicum]|uniref:Hypotherical protein n=1 Tax=Schistosoma japonicum TaxID=6182 RepID=Q5DGC1_SCHJA|nr:SJCHGC06536 protein [Schistosoma japonicum]KAH8868711.1 Programmed cell death protein 5 [Schistosoma japonicum]CAX73774.1 hypotherical protein [Schistosoma japonicum]